MSLTWELRLLLFTAAITMNIDVEDAVSAADGGDWLPLHEAHGEESCSQAHGIVSHGT